MIDHCLSEEKLAETFPGEYKELPHEVYRRLHIIPETFIVDEHHVHASKDNDGTIVKAPRPADLFRNSIATASLVASIINGKYNNALPLEHQPRAYRNNGINLATNTMANWVNMDSIRGAQASAILYSLVETAKANNLRVYEYLEYLLDGLSRHADDTDRDFLKNLLPWSETAQKKCHSLKKS